MASTIYLVFLVLLVVLILSLIGFILYKKNKKISRKYLNEKEKFDYYQKKTYELLESIQTPEIIFKDFEKLIKSFFMEYYQMDKKYTYLELAKKFEKKKKIYHSQFCTIVSEFKYSNEKIKTKDLRELISAFKKLILID